MPAFASQVSTRRLDVSRRGLAFGLLGVPVAVSLLMWGRRSKKTIADGLVVPHDPRIARSCQDFIDMMRLRGSATYPRGFNSVDVDNDAWQRLALIERIALANAVAGRAFGKHARFLSENEIGRIHMRGPGHLLAIARASGVEFS